MTRNLNRVDRILRFVLAVWWLSPIAPQFKIEWVNLIIVIIAWIALLESFLGWCLLHSLFGVNDSKK